MSSPPAVEPPSETRTCVPCGGRGREVSVPGYKQYPCFWCDGTGKITQVVAPPPCPSCGQPNPSPVDGERQCANCIAWEPCDLPRHAVRLR